MDNITDEVLWMMGLAVLSLGLLLICSVQHRQIAQLKSRLHHAYFDQSPLTYLRDHLADKPKLEAIKALRSHYPELSLLEAVRLWEQR